MFLAQNVFYYGKENTKKVKFQKHLTTDTSTAHNDELEQMIYRYCGVVMIAMKIFLILVEKVVVIHRGE